MKLPKPNNSTQEVLYSLLTNGKTSIKEFFYLCGFRTRISDLTLKHGILLTKEIKQGKNKFGNAYTYKEHSIAPEYLEKAKELYLKLCENKNK